MAMLAIFFNLIFINAVILRSQVNLSCYLVKTKACFPLLHVMFICLFTVLNTAVYIQQVSVGYVEMLWGSLCTVYDHDSDLEG